MAQWGTLLFILCWAIVHMCILYPAKKVVKPLNSACIIKIYLCFDGDSPGEILNVLLHPQLYFSLQMIFNAGPEQNLITN